MVPVADIRAQGLDVRVARYAPSENISIAMFSGGGMAWADAAMKRGEIAVPPAPPGAHPDLSGLSCRYEEIPASRGAGAVAGGRARRRARAPRRFRAAIEEIARIVEKTPDASRPVPGQRLRFTWPPAGADLEARASRRAGESIRARKIKVLALTLLVFPDHAFRHHGRQLHSGEIHPRADRQFRFPEVRRFAPHGARLHAGAGRRDRAAPRPTAPRRASCATARTASTPR